MRIMGMTQVVEIEGRKYRPVTISDRWAKSEFEYFSEARNEWRRVNNWDRREKLFHLLSKA